MTNPLESIMVCLLVKDAKVSSKEAYEGTLLILAEHFKIAQ